MKNWLLKWRYRIARLMQGRYGSDRLNMALLVVSLILAVLSMIPRLFWLSLVNLLLLICITFRCFSKNIGKRQRELGVYLRLSSRISKWLTLQKNKWRDRKTHDYFKCPKCKAVLRVPKKKGGGTVCCPECGERTVRK